MPIVARSLPRAAKSGQIAATSLSGSRRPRSTNMASTVAVIPLLHDATTINPSPDIGRWLMTSIPAHRSTTLVP
jgi:hypothetical protein